MLFTKLLSCDIIINRFMLYDIVGKFSLAMIDVFFYSYIYMIFFLSGIYNEFAFNRAFRSFRNSFFVDRCLVDYRTRKFLSGRIIRRFFLLSSMLLPGFLNFMNFDFFRSFVSLQSMKNNHIIYLNFTNSGGMFLFNDVLTRILGLRIISVRREDIFFRMPLAKLNYSYKVNFFLPFSLFDSNEFYRIFYEYFFSYFGYSFFYAKVGTIKKFSFYSKVI
jgi:hypothetical protein